MSTAGAEAQQRIARHRAQRAGLSFRTVEACGRQPLSDAVPGTQGVFLVEDLGNLVANALFDENGLVACPEDRIEQLSRMLHAFASRVEHVVFVGNEVGSEGRAPGDDVELYVRLIGTLCCQVASWCDTVVEVVAGIPCCIKGALPADAVQEAPYSGQDRFCCQADRRIAASGQAEGVPGPSVQRSFPAAVRAGRQP